MSSLLFRVVPSLVVLACATRVAAQTPAGQPATFSKDIAPILQRACQSCHNPDGIGPMSGWAAPAIPADGRYAAFATFSEPGEYVVRVMAHDGGLATTADVRVVVE